jgi:hypothetical protein
MVGDDKDKGIEGEKCYYEIPATWADFQRLTQLATAEGEQNRIMAAYEYGHGLKARSAARPEGGAVTLPIISHKKWGKVNLVTGEHKDGKGVADGKFTLDSLLKILNGRLMEAAAMDSEPLRAVKVAIDQLKTEGKVVADGQLLKIAGK